MDSSEMFLGPIAATFLIGVTTFLLMIWYSSIKQTYWKKRNIPFVEPLPIIGSILDIFKAPLHDIELERYKKKGQIYGHFEGSRPLLSVGDTRLLREILVKDFPHFTNRRSFASGDDTLDKMMFALEGEDWKRVRSVVSPTFSTGKLKRVLSIFKDCARTLVQNFKMAAAKGEYVNAKKMYGALAMDVIASSAFSTKLDSHNDPENKFVQAARKSFPTGFNWRFGLLLLAPKLCRLLGISGFNPQASNFFKHLSIEIIKERKRTGQTRNDFLQLLIDTAEEVANEEKWGEEDKDLENYEQQEESQKYFNNATNKKLSMEEVVAQCVIFFLAGYDTTASCLSFTSFLLATNEGIQDKVREEITECLKETNGELTYEALQKMKYLDNVISESLRMFPPAIRLERRAHSDYALGDTGITVPKDMIITIPNYALHWDPKHYPNPEKFDPNRFTAEERAKRDPFAYMPFGAGPRNCVGMRFALLEIKMCLVYVISCFNIKTCPKTQVFLLNHVLKILLSPTKDLIYTGCPQKGEHVNSLIIENS